MAKVNVKSTKPVIVTHEGGKASNISNELELERSVLSCMLFEDTFYESGNKIASRITELCKHVSPKFLSELAIKARTEYKLRSVPLFLVRQLAKKPGTISLTSNTLYKVIQRADELAEFVAIYWKDGKQPLSNQVKKGLAKAFTKFNEYDLAKYNRDGNIKLRDVLFLVHAKPENKTQEKLWKKLINNKLKTPVTWETELSAGKDKKETWIRLLKENKLGALALLRNLRNMESVGVDRKLVKKALSEIKVERVLPFRFLTAARYAPHLEPELEISMLKSLNTSQKLKGRTILLLDVSGSMDSTINGKTEISGIDAACGIGILLREMCEDIAVYSFSDRTVLIPARKGFALRDAINNSQDHNGTMLGQAIRDINKKEKYDRLIVITDEQSHDNVGDCKGKGYIINVASYANGVAYDKYVHINGFSEAVINYLIAYEKLNNKK